MGKLFRHPCLPVFLLVAGVFSRFSDMGIHGDVWGYIGAHVVELSCGLKA